MKIKATSGIVIAPASAERIINNGFLAILTSSGASPGLIIVLIKLPVNGSRMIPESINEITIRIIRNTDTQPRFGQKFLWASAIVLVIVLPILVSSTIITGRIKR